ncbi:hypothetical protein SAMD00019534_070780 [Acytostelium subglobosum LB1]|uniref:hypothetical protein n=1 Tax=Acytostelium subglobosum LB1 TaxID=1410327 RepID=UPI0006450D70|nr:hypothetical protein SAMD00019534_070780 [Acytostelium subglobosum LB1]GAM23903.1 hypothetical protein SAMD00019534_070780 [Acytostelium subglobosum LB1]|eukprot:XP_012752939.1 hypothetical protein SAMD00019534_070780 [Acytostelium subglobosum LB1]
MSNPTLYYFDARARAEVSRLLLAYTKTTFTDSRSPFPLPQEVKDKTTFGQLPYFEDANNQLSQSIAIEQYIAELHNLAGSNPIERSQILQFALFPGDLYQPYFLAKDEASNLKFKVETAPKLLARLEAILIKAGGQHFVGDKITWADISIFNLIDFFHLQHDNLVEAVQGFPTLLAFHKRIAAIPVFAEYLNNRVKTRL